MKRKLGIYLILVGILLYCTEKKTYNEKSIKLPRIVNKEVLITYDNCIPDSLNCTYFQLDYPIFSDTLDEQLNLVLQEKLSDAVSSYFSEKALGGTFEYLGNLFVRDYNRFKIDFPNYRMGWYLKGFLEIIYESEKVLSFRIDIESFTGGAHPNSSTTFCVIDKNLNRALSTAEIITDTIKFKRILEDAFRNQKGIVEGQSLADKGYYLEDGNILLNNNIGISEESIIVHFNPYEIAPYALGASTVEIEKSELIGLLKVD